MGKVVLVDAGGDANVTGVEAGGKGMFGKVLPPGFEIEAQLPDDIDTKIPLQVTRVVVMEKAIVDLGTGSDAVEEVFQRQAHGAEYLVKK